MRAISSRARRLRCRKSGTYYNGPGPIGRQARGGESGHITDSGGSRRWPARSRARPAAPDTSIWFAPSSSASSRERSKARPRASARTRLRQPLDSGDGRRGPARRRQIPPDWLTLSLASLLPRSSLTRSARQRRHCGADAVDSDLSLATGLRRRADHPYLRHDYQPVEAAAEGFVFIRRDSRWLRHSQGCRCDQWRLAWPSPLVR